MRNKTSAKAHCYAQTKISIIQINWIRSDWNEPAIVAALVTMLHWLLAVLGNHIYKFFSFKALDSRAVFLLAGHNIAPVGRDAG